MYYTMDAVMAVLMLIVMFKIEVTPSKDSAQSLPMVVKKVTSPIFALFILNLAVFGILYSLVQYYIIFAQSDLGASSEIIGKWADKSIRNGK